jgi:hypothetical protein
MWSPIAGDPPLSRPALEEPPHRSLKEALRVEGRKGIVGVDSGAAAGVAGLPGVEEVQGGLVVDDIASLLISPSKDA